MITFIKDILHCIFGYSFKYFDMNGKHIYVKTNYKRFKDIQDEHKLILKSFGHLIYFFKKDLKINKITKISKNAFIKDIYKVKQEYFSDTFINREDTAYHNNKLTELLEVANEIEEEINC